MMSSFGCILASYAWSRTRIIFRRCIDEMPEREQFITRVGALFDKELFSDTPLHDLRQPLAALHQQCQKRSWGLCKTLEEAENHSENQTVTHLTGVQPKKAGRF